MKKGELIGQRYQLDRAIGQGGTGRIWLARDTRLDRRVAIKFLLARSAYHRVRYARRVALEAKIAASIQHRNVVQIFDFGTHTDQTPYIVMEALSGFTLGEAFDDARTFSLDAVIHIMSEVLRGLAAVHDAGIVHRDLKPENIFLVKESRGRLSPKLLDFGISRSLEPESRRSAVTTTEGMIIGTPQYMSPEQARGDRDIDKRTDIYSIGTIMFEALVGLVPFPAENVSELLIAIIQREAPPLFGLAPQLGAPLCEVVDKALKKDRAQRYAHAAEMQDALLAAAQRLAPGFDRHAALFPPETIRTRINSRRPRLGEDGAPEDAASSPSLECELDQVSAETTPEPILRTRARRGLASPLSASPPGELPESAPAQPLESAAQGGGLRPQARGLGTSPVAWSVGAIAVISLGVGVSALIMLRDRASAPAGAGMIVVQAPAPAAAPPTQRPAAAPSEEPSPAAAPAQPPGEPPAQAPASTGNTSADKRAATVKPQRAADAADPMRLIASGVAHSFSKQKARVIDCLNKHPDEITDSPQLTVRVSLDQRGDVTQAELLPETISSQPVGACVRAAVKGMSFPKPAEPMTFRVPLLWRRK